MRKFDYLEVTGSYEDVGRAIGTKFKNVIGESIESRQRRIPDYDGYLRKTEPYFRAAVESFPNLAREMEAIAHAAGVPLADYFSLNNREANISNEDDHCTVAVSFGNDGAVIAHNEDWEGATPDALYILKARIGETTFMGLQYKVTIPGVAVTINNWGLTQCINDLSQTSQIGVPKNFVARAVLECKTLDSAESLIRKTRKASGFNHVLVQGREVRNIEIAGDKMDVEKVIGEPYVHTNHYLASGMKAFEKYHTKSSMARYKRAKEMVQSGMTVTQMEELLRDTKNKKFPISRANATLGSFIAVPNEKKVYICYGPPDAGEYKDYSPEQITTPSEVDGVKGVEG